MSKQLSWKKSLLVICKVLGLLVNTLTANDKNFLLNCDNLKKRIQMQLSKKQKIFSLFSKFLKSRLSFKHFLKRGDSHSLCISEIKDCKNVVRQMSKKSRLRRPLNKIHGKRSQRLLKSEREHLYHLY